MAETTEETTARFFDTLDRAKGILIVLIVFAHNTILAQAWPESRAFLYNWHVYAFLLLAMMMPFRSDRSGFLAARFVRYYVPFIAFFTLTWAAMLVLSRSLTDLPDRLGEWAAAVLIGSAPLLDEASGARLFWFLPALMGLVLIRWAIDRVPEATRGPTLVLVAAAGFLLAGLIPEDVKPWVPFGLPIALYALGPGLVFTAVVSKLLQATGSARRLGMYALASAAACALLYALSLRQGTNLVLAAFQFYDVRSPIALFNHALIAMTGAAAVVFGAGAIGRSRVLSWLGQASLLIYLLHQIVFVGLRAPAARFLSDPGSSQALWTGFATFAATMAVTSGVVWAIRSSEVLTSLLSPRDWQDWCDGWGRLFSRPTRKDQAG